MWEIYDRLIDGIPESLRVDAVVESGGMALVKSGGGIGIGVAQPWETRPATMTKDMLGLPLRELGGLVRSWNLLEAAVGHAAINAWYNGVSTAEKNGVPLSAARHSEDRKNDPFIAYQREIRGKTVGVVGHFPYLEKLFAPVCKLYIFGKEAIPGDYPEGATEYLLPECDYVFLSCSSLNEKTLPHFLELSAHAYTVMVGPATTLAPCLFEYGVDDLAGFVVRDGELAAKIVSGVRQIKIYKSGQKVSYKRAFAADRPCG